jgi:hypothetical protein
LRITSVDFDLMDEILDRYSAFVAYYREDETVME